MVKYCIIMLYGRSETFKHLYYFLIKIFLEEKYCIVQWVIYDKGKIFFSRSFVSNCFKKFQDHPYLLKWYRVFLT